ncbi:hypothetical protein [Chitinophaga nivalis]|uniref:Phage tail collar domain-containing protein n=1 Tax=Chitinophaga nivalis TaxID=2991709 RepID=A0ABT3IFC1_9BACT|nr:hypothetical protein [Chitinophaga nivalis]MCW3467648.1 hypothetical protein [Chitinophaga nivalis]MCW3482660.1 hypothetical protein [Chitinophaga nivalis]
MSHRRIDFSNLGGFPVTQYTLDYLQQNSQDTIHSLTAMAGNGVIISGLTESAGIISNGWIIWENELLPFIGGPVGMSTFIVEEKKENALFGDDTTREVYITRQARFAAGGFNFADLVRINSLREFDQQLKLLKATLSKEINAIWKKGDVIELDVSPAYLAANFDGTGLGRGERTGWAICNGNNGTRNRGGKFPVGYTPFNSDYAFPGLTGGQDNVYLSVDHLPPHDHAMPSELKKGNGLGVRGGNAVSRGSNEPSLDRSGQTGRGLPFDNRPSYIVTIWIMKL